MNPENTPESHSQSWEEKLAILRKNGYSPERLDAIEKELELPPIPNDIIVQDGKMIEDGITVC